MMTQMTVTKYSLIAYRDKVADFDILEEQDQKWSISCIEYKGRYFYKDNTNGGREVVTMLEGSPPVSVIGVGVET